jgi:hypothetical protein
MAGLRLVWRQNQHADAEPAGEPRLRPVRVPSASSRSAPARSRSGGCAEVEAFTADQACSGMQPR